jgi:hypothetical protein
VWAAGSLLAGGLVSLLLVTAGRQVRH